MLKAHPKMSALKPRFVISPHRRGMSHRNTGRRPLTKGQKKFGSGGGIGFGGGGFKSNNHLASKDRGDSLVDASTQRGNINVVVRVRRANPSEMGPTRRLIVQAVDEKLIIFDPKEEDSDFYFHGEKQKSRHVLKKPNKDKKFVFDSVYGPSHTNQEIFERTIKPTIDTVLSGCNCSVFAYGATGSGKTYTMLGSPGNPGITFLTVMELYRRLTEMSDEFETEIQVSYVEVYNEDIKDLLASSGLLNVREDSNGDTVIPDLTLHRPADSDELFRLISHGNSIRSQHPTDQNAESSRSHAIFQVYVKLRGRFTDMMNNCKSAKLVMVDLAGSERGAATGCKGKRFREGSSINKSLLALGNCITALADGKRHVPYRDSKLTRILKDALGGNCKTVMIANVSPSDTSYNETDNTLRYADRAKRIQFQVKKNVMTVHARIAQYGLVVDEMSSQIASLKKQLEEKGSNCHCQVSKKDVWTETEKHFCQNSSFEFNSETGRGGGGPMNVSSNILTIPNNIPVVYSNFDPNEDDEVIDYVKFFQERRRLEQTRYETVMAARELEAKVNYKKKRIQCAESLKNTDLSSTEALEKMKKRMETQESESRTFRDQAEKNKTDLNNLIAQINQRDQNRASRSVQNVSISLDDYIYFRSLQSDVGLFKGIDDVHLKVQNYLADQIAQSETLLGKAVVLLKPLYYLSKHHGYITTENDDAYKTLMSEYFGKNRIQFADGDKENTNTSKIPELNVRANGKKQIYVLGSPGHGRDYGHGSTIKNGPSRQNCNLSYTVNRY